MTQPLRLHYAPDNASLCVRLALDARGITYDTCLVDRGQRAQKSPAYLALNPNGLIPVLETPAGPMFETGAILLWIADSYGGLMPAPDAPARGAALQWLFWLSNTLHANLRMLFYPGEFAGDHQAAIHTMAQGRVAGQLALLNDARGTDWLDADTPTAQGCYLAPMLRWLALYGAPNEWFDLSATPRLLAFAQRADTWHATARAITAEGLGPTPFSAPRFPNPPEGRAI